MRLEAFAVRPSVIPEPSTDVLMGLGLVGLASRRRERPRFVQVADVMPPESVHSSGKSARIAGCGDTTATNRWVRLPDCELAAA